MRDGADHIGNQQVDRAVAAASEFQALPRALREQGLIDLSGHLLFCRHVINSQLIKQETEDISPLLDFFIQSSADAVPSTG